MSGPISIGSAAEWQTLLSSTNVVVADFYADWCGPCKMIAPHFERLAKEHSSPKKAAFAKINVDTQSTIARTHGVAAMPTFIIFHGGQAIKTIKGANPPALTQAVTDALKLGDAPRGSNGAFEGAGRTLGGETPAASLQRPTAWYYNEGFKNLFFFLGLYVVSLLSFDPYMAAKNSQFNVVSPPPPPPTQARNGTAGSATRPAQRPAFKTLADLGGDE